MTRRQSNGQWNCAIAAHPAQKKFRVQKSAGKVLASIFWDQDGILLIDYFPKGQTINAEYHSSLLVQLENILKEKRRGKFTKGFLMIWERKILRKMYGQIYENGYWRIKINEEICNECKSPDIVIVIQVHRMEWLGHAIRMDRGRALKKLMEGQPEGPKKEDIDDDDELDLRNMGVKR